MCRLMVRGLGLGAIVVKGMMGMGSLRDMVAIEGKIRAVESFEDTSLDVSLAVKFADVSDCGDNFEFFFIST
ncbi:hypothetical protein Tco_0942096 [Tanacetum coccineum]